MKAFIIIETERKFGNEYKARTESGTEVWVKKSELIPFVEFPQKEEAPEDFGFVKINGVAMTAQQVKTYLQIHEGVLKQYEDLKEAYKKMQRLSDNVLQAVLDAHRIFASVDTKTSKIDRYTVKFLEELRMYRSSGLTPEDVRKIGSQVKKHD